MKTIYFISVGIGISPVIPYCVTDLKDIKQIVKRVFPLIQDEDIILKFGEHFYNEPAKIGLIKWTFEGENYTYEIDSLTIVN